MQFTDEQQRFINEHYQLLPKGANGEPIRVGDKVVRRVNGCQLGEVTGIGDGVFFARHYMSDYHKHFSSDFIHHHAPTVEDVLRDMCLEIDRRCERGSIDYDELFAEYAAKLRLAGDAQ